MRNRNSGLEQSTSYLALAELNVKLWLQAVVGAMSARRRVYPHLLTFIESKSGIAPPCRMFPQARAFHQGVLIGSP